MSFGFADGNWQDEPSDQEVESVASEIYGWDGDREDPILDTVRGEIMSDRFEEEYDDED